MPEAWVALGCNLGDREMSLRTALRAVGSFCGILRLSSIYETEPVGFADQPAFLNAVVNVATELDARTLLNRLLQVERDMGRERTLRNGPRAIDLDLLIYGELVLKEPALEVPHPRLHERRFVLAPLAELVPDLVHPALGQTIAGLLAQLPAGEWVRRFGALEGWS